MAQPTWQSFALALKQLRLRQGLTQDQLAARSGVSVRSLSDLERGVSRAPHRDTIQLISVALDLEEEETERLLALARAGALGGDDAELAVGYWVAPCIGRERELASIQSALDRPGTRLLSLIGVVGVGKTRLATEIMARMSAADGMKTVFVELGSIPGSRYVLPAIAHRLGLREHPVTPILDVIQQGIGPDPLLLISIILSIWATRGPLSWR